MAHKSLTPKMNRALAVLMAGGTRQEAADRAAVNRKTLYCWEHTPGHPFFEAMAELREYTSEEVRSVALRTCSEGLELIRRDILNPKTSAAVRGQLVGQLIKLAELDRIPAEPTEKIPDPDEWTKGGGGLVD